MLGILHYDWMHILLLSALLALEFRAWVQPIQSSDDLTDLIALDPSTSAVVIRDGTLAEIAATDLVPGDIVHISEVKQFVLYSAKHYANITTGHGGTGRWSPCFYGR